MLINLDEFILSVDFIIFDIKQDEEIPLIFGKPFLASGRIVIDVQKGKLIFRVEDEQVTFDMLKAMNFSHEVDSYFHISECHRLTNICKGNSLTLALEVCLRLHLGAEIFSVHLSRSCTDENISAPK